MVSFHLTRGIAGAMMAMSRYRSLFAMCVSVYVSIGFCVRLDVGVGLRDCALSLY